MDDQKKTADARAALLESGDEDAQKAVLAWEKRNSHENEVGSYLEIGGRRLGPFYTFGEISLKVARRSLGQVARTCNEGR
jgi:hypothetical protein